MEHELFISYSHTDNKSRSITDESAGWIDELHAKLEETLWRYRGRPPKIWRDKKLKGNDELNPEIYDSIKASELLLCVCSPSYIRSDWCPKELDEFVQASRARGGESDSNKSRVLKVLKMPLGQDDLPAAVQGQLGYEFFERTGDDKYDFEEIDPSLDEEKFIRRLQDVAKDICRTLDESQAPTRGKVYLARPTADLETQYLSVKRELEDKRYEVLPDRVLSAESAAQEAEIDEMLGQCDASVHLIGKFDEEQARDFKPANASRQLSPHLEFEMALKRCREGKLSSLVWIPDDLDPATEQQQEFVTSILESETLPRPVDVVTVGFEDLKTTLREQLDRVSEERKKREAAAAKADSSDAGVDLCVYVTYHRCDEDDPHLKGILDGLSKEGIELFQPIFDAEDPGEVREYHQESLAECDGVIIFAGGSKSMWLQAQKRDLMKSRRPTGGLVFYLGPPSTEAKDRFQSNKGDVIREAGEFRPESISEFLTNLKAKD